MTTPYPRTAAGTDPVERKVKASTAAATLTAGVLSLLGLYVFHGAVPDWVSVVAETAVTGLLTLAAGWWVKYTPRALPPAKPTVVSGPGVLPEDEPPLT
jgi:hypothetical protein